MKTTIFALLLALPGFANAFEAGKLSCEFDADYVVTGALDTNGVLDVETYYNDWEIVDEKGEDGNQLAENPIKPETTKGGRLAYTLDLTDDDPDYGDVYVLYVPQNITKGAKVLAHLSGVHFSRGETGRDYLPGTCTLN